MIWGYNALLMLCFILTGKQLSSQHLHVTNLVVVLENINSARENVFLTSEVPSLTTWKRHIKIASISNERYVNNNSVWIKNSYPSFQMFYYHPSHWQKCSASRGWFILEHYVATMLLNLWWSRCWLASFIDSENVFVGHLWVLNFW